MTRAGSGEARKERRRRQHLLWLVSSAKANDEVIKRLADKAKVKVSTVREDLANLQDDLENTPSEELLADLKTAIEAADTFSALKRVGKKLMLDMLEGRIDRSLGQALVDGIKEQRQLLIREREEKVEASIMALEILTPEEDAFLREHRKKLAGPPLKPGEAVPPPVLADSPKGPESPKEPTS